MHWILFAIFIGLLYHIDISASYNILAILPISGRSHFITFEPILLELTRRGHNVTVYSSFPKQLPISNYTDVDISSCWGKKLQWGIEETIEMSELEYAIKLHQILTPKEVAACQPLIQLRDYDASENNPYHLLITQFWVTDWTLGYAYKFGIPIVGITSSVLKPWISTRVGQIENPAYLRYGHAPQDDPRRANIISRLRNVYSYLAYVLTYELYGSILANDIMRELFGRPFPSVDEIARNTSLILVNSHWTTSQVKPYVPEIIHFGGIISKASPLPQNIEEFINKFENGVVYFAMGSVLKSTNFSEEKRKAFVTAFSKLSLGVIWKWEHPELEMKPDNVFISEWLPQRDILAHPNIRLFISHGGQSSINEAVHEGVPVVGIPLFKDQFSNINALVDAGAAELIAYQQLTAETLFSKINKVLSDKSYRVNAKKLSALYKDRPMSPMDTAVYWIEYVIRHKGAHHLRSPAVGMPWYRYFLIDVILMIIFLIVSIIFIVYTIIKTIFKIIACKLLKRDKSKIKTN